MCKDPATALRVPINRGKEVPRKVARGARGRKAGRQLLRDMFCFWKSFGQALSHSPRVVNCIFVETIETVGAKLFGLSWKLGRFI